MAESARHHSAGPGVQPGTSGAFRLRVGDRSRAELLDALAAAGVRLNAYADTLVAHPMFEAQRVEDLAVVLRSPAELGLPGGGTHADVLRAAARHGLKPFPPYAGPYLRLAMLDQQNAPDSILSTGKAPTSSIHVAAEPVSDDEQYPRGFYLRVIDHVPWLRGYRCSADFASAPDDVFVFRA